MELTLVFFRQLQDPLVPSDQPMITTFQPAYGLVRIYELSWLTLSTPKPKASSSLSSSHRRIARWVARPQDL